MVYTIINPYFTGERNRPTFKTLSKGSQLESFKAAIWTQAIWLQNPCSLQQRLSPYWIICSWQTRLAQAPTIPQKKRLTHGQMSIDTTRFHLDSLKVSSPIASWIIRITTQRGNLHKDGTTVTLAILAHTQEQLKLRCLTALTIREMQIKTTTW